MFKKTKIAAVTAAVLGLSSMTAQAISVNDTGSQGQVLVFPYYNVNNGFVTVFKITNTTDAYKAVKIRYRESENSNDVLDFNLYLSPYDVFRMDLIQGSDGGVNLLAPDNSCTHPAIPKAGVLFRHQAYYSTSVEDVREGYLEVIEMGEIDETATVSILGRPVSIANGILHTDGVPNNCGVIEAAWQQGVFTPGGAKANAGNLIKTDAVGYPKYANQAGYYGFSRAGGLTKPKGGLVGSSILVDGPNVSGYVTEPLSVVNYSTIPQQYLSSDQNFYLLPSLASGSIESSEHLTYDVNGGPVGTIQEYSTVARDWGLDDQNVLPRVSVPSGINPMPIANAMLVNSLGNQYFLNDGTTTTDWVVSAPMRKHAIYNNYQYVAANTTSGLIYTKGVAASEDAEGNFVPGVGDIPVGGNIGDETSVTGAFWKYLDATDVNAGFAYWDNEEGQSQLDPGDFSPPLVTPPSEIPFEREVNILALHSADAPAAESVLGSVNAQGLLLDAGYSEGWGAFIFNDYRLHGTRYAEWVDLSDTVGPGVGVPLFGFMAAKSDLDSQSLGETFPHFYNRSR